MRIEEIVNLLEDLAPPALQESYDNSGLLTGDAGTLCTGILVSLDVTEEVVEEAVRKKCNLIVCHHPIIFKGLKKLTGSNYVERTVISAIQNHISIYAIHTNLDNVLHGVNKKIADCLELQNRSVLMPREYALCKLVTFVPTENAESVRDALFKAGAGDISDYSECSFNLEGTGTFKAGEGTDPLVGEIGERHKEKEVRIEVILPSHLTKRVLNELRSAHPYEEVAYYLHPLLNRSDRVGSGLVGDLNHEISERELLQMLKLKFNLKVIRHTALNGKKIKKIALCGGSGVFLLEKAKQVGAQAFITGDVKYHEFFDADRKIFLADIGHFESEQFTIPLLCDFLKEKLHNFAVLNSETNTNAVHYYF